VKQRFIVSHYGNLAPVELLECNQFSQMFADLTFETFLADEKRRKTYLESCALRNDVRSAGVAPCAIERTSSQGMIVSIPNA